MSSATSTLDSSHVPAARAASTSARFVRLFDPGGVTVAAKRPRTGSIVTSLMTTAEGVR